MTRPGQVMLIDLKTGQQLEYPIQVEDGHLVTIFDKLNVYLLYKTKLVIISKQDFIKRCLPFDVRKYESNLKQFNNTLDSIGISNDTVVSVALSKLNYLKKIYSGTEHIQIKQRLKALNVQVFQMVKWKFPNGYIDCYEQQDLPIEQRRKCLISLIDQYGRLSNFEKVLQLEATFEKTFGNPRTSGEYDFAETMDSTKKYVLKIDSLNNAGLSNDSLFYFKTMALETICQTYWYCPPTCAGCDYSIIYDQLKLFHQKFPRSKLCDNAAFYLFVGQTQFDFEEDQSIVELNSAYEKFLKKYPDSDLKANILIEVFYNWASMQVLNKKEINSVAQRIFQEFPTNKRIPYVKKRLDSLNKGQRD